MHTSAPFECNSNWVAVFGAQGLSSEGEYFSLTGQYIYSRLQGEALWRLAHTAVATSVRLLSILKMATANFSSGNR